MWIRHVFIKLFIAFWFHWKRHFHRPLSVAVSLAIEFMFHFSFFTFFSVMAMWIVCSPVCYTSYLCDYCLSSCINHTFRWRFSSLLIEIARWFMMKKICKTFLYSLLLFFWRHDDVDDKPENTDTDSHKRYIANDNFYDRKKAPYVFWVIKLIPMSTKCPFRP